MSRLSARATAALVFCLSLGAAAPGAQAHPHVWISGVSQVAFGADRSIVAVRHSWTFDEMFSTMAIQGLDANGDGTYSREELASLAQVNVTSLSEFDFFTFMKAGAVEPEFSEPVDYWLDYAGGQLTLHFTLPLKSPLAVTAGQVELAVYDPSYFVAFNFAKKDPVSMAGAPAGCAIDLKRGADPDNLQQTYLSKFGQLDVLPDASFGEQFAETVFVSCR